MLAQRKSDNPRDKVMAVDDVVGVVVVLRILHDASHEFVLVVENEVFVIGCLGTSRDMYEHHIAGNINGTRSVNVLTAGENVNNDAPPP